MSARRNELTRTAARLFAEKGYHGTSIGDLAEAMGVQKGSLYAHIESKADLLWEVARDGAVAFHAALDAVPDDLPPAEKIRLALRAHLQVVAEQLDVATVFIREWRYLEGDRREQFLSERRRYEERFRALFQEGVTYAPTSTTAPPRCSRCRPRTGPTPGFVRVWTRTSSRTASTDCCWTACADTRHPCVLTE
jgi:AcrR family transcriptional regulator